MTTARAFALDADLPAEVVEPGRLHRKIRARGGGLMMVEAFFEQGAEGALHAHPHEQVTYCLEGEFRFTVGEQSTTLGPGDSVYVAPHAMHGALCTRAGRLLDVFTPQREDFLA